MILADIAVLIVIDLLVNIINLTWNVSSGQTASCVPSCRTEHRKAAALLTLFSTAAAFQLRMIVLSTWHRHSYNVFLFIIGIYKALLQKKKKIVAGDECNEAQIPSQCHRCFEMTLFHYLSTSTTHLRTAKLRYFRTAKVWSVNYTYFSELACRYVSHMNAGKYWSAYRSMGHRWFGERTAIKNVAYCKIVFRVCLVYCCVNIYSDAFWKKNIVGISAPFSLLCPLCCSCTVDQNYKQCFTNKPNIKPFFWKNNGFKARPCELHIVSEKGSPMQELLTTITCLTWLNILRKFDTAQGLRYLYGSIGWCTSSWASDYRFRQLVQISIALSTSRHQNRPFGGVHLLESHRTVGLILSIIQYMAFLNIWGVCYTLLYLYFYLLFSIQATFPRRCANSLQNMIRHVNTGVLTV